MKGDLFFIESYFNKLINFEELKIKTKRCFDEILQDEKSAIFEDCTEEEISKIKNSTIKYSDTYIFINNIGSFPFFRIKYDLYFEESNIPNFTYEVEYNVNGEILDDYFLEI